jgi:flavin-dependent dehydrogenase
VLRAHQILTGKAAIAVEEAESLDLPLAAALAHEGVANRTLLIGPAGGFFSACSEDIYPNCWSAVFAADAVKKALKEPHLQDALQPYRHRWRTTLGDYLRGPQQNLRFLLPLVYRNQVMTTRLTESILLGKSVVR